MASQADILQWFASIKATAHELASNDLPDVEQGRVKELVGSALCIGESVVLDLNRIANALEFLADHAENKL